MTNRHTVEKIGGSSMSRFGEVMDNVIIGKRQGDELYNRVFVVSAYGGITNLLLENKKTGAPGVWAKFAENNPGWLEALEKVRKQMISINRSFESIGLDQQEADEFVNTRLDSIRECIKDLIRLRSYGHFNPKHYLLPARELLAAVGEAHSAFNSTLILRRHGVNAKFIDMTGWHATESAPLEPTIEKYFADIQYENELPIVTGYVKYDEGIMSRFDRGYSEITFSKIAVLTHAREGIIHKEYHLCTGDPVLIGVDKVKVIGQTNFDIADQMSDMDMEAIHSKASKEMELQNIPIRVKNAFDPDHPGTIISRDYVSPVPRVEMVSGRDDVIELEVHDPEMVGQFGYDHDLLESFLQYEISFICTNTNANTICHYVPEKLKKLHCCLADLHRRMPHSHVEIKPVAIVTVMGSNMKVPGFLAKCAKALADEGINILGVDQCSRQVNIQFIVERERCDDAQIALHRELIEKA